MIIVLVSSFSCEILKRIIREFKWFYRIQCVVRKSLADFQIMVI